MSKIISCRVSNEIFEKILDQVQARQKDQSDIIRDALIKGLGLSDTVLTRVQIESLCLLRRLVADEKPALFQLAKEDAALLLKQLNIS